MTDGVVDLLTVAGIAYPRTMLLIIILFVGAVGVYVWGDVVEDRRTQRLIGIVEGLAGIDVVTQRVHERRPEWRDWRRGIDSWLRAIHLRIQGTCGIAHIIAVDGAKPFAFAQSISPKINDLYAMAKLGIMESRDVREARLLLEADLVGSALYREHVTEIEWRRFASVMRDADELIEAISVLARRGCLTCPPTLSLSPRRHT